MTNVLPFRRGRRRRRGLGPTAQVLSFPLKVVHIWPAPDGARLGAYVAVAEAGMGNDGPIADAKHFADWSEGMAYAFSLEEVSGYTVIDHLQAAELEALYG